MSKIEIPFDSELQEQEIHIPEGFEASIEGGKIILRKVESEDERIRKDVLAFIRREGQHIEKYKWHKWLAWLEKQGEPKELSQTKVTKISDKDDDLDALGQAIYALESFVVEDKPNKCFAGHHVPFIKAIEILKSLKQRLAL